MRPRISIFLVVAVCALLGGIQARADNLASIGITPETGVVTLVPRWGVGTNLAGFHFMAQDLSLGGGANQFYSIKGTSIPAGGDVAAFTRYIAASGAATNHVDIGSKLSPNSYSALTSADPDVGYGPVNLYFIHHKATGDYFTVIVPSSGTASAVTDLKPMAGPGGPATLGASGYFGLTYAAANLGYGLNLFYYLRTDAVTGHAKFGSLDPALAGFSADKFDLGTGGYNALAFTGSNVGFGTDRMYYLRLDPVTGFTIFGTLHPLTGRTADIANLGSVYSTLTFVPGDVGFGSGRFYTTGTVNPTWQSVSFAAIADRSISAGSFTVAPTASSGLPITLTVVAGSTGSATISGPVAGVFTVTPTVPGLIVLQATQAGQLVPVAYESNMLRQGFMALDGVLPAGNVDFNGDGQTDILWENASSGDRGIWIMNGTVPAAWVNLPTISLDWRIAGAGDFNGDRQTDILWENVGSGDHGLWIMNGSVPAAWVSLPSISPDWRIAGAGDFNGDGQTDIIWENASSGDRGLWIMNGTTPVAWINLPSIALNWRIAGAGDFNGDGQTDIIWENASSGDRGLWIMNGTVPAAWVSLPSISLNWRIAGAGDFNGDDMTDILWENVGSGDRGLWIMNGTVPAAWIGLPTLTVDWRIAQ